jgi:cytochrome c2
MRARTIQWWFLAALALILAGCGLQPLPYAPTPIPTLAPATLPAPVSVTTAGAPVGQPMATPAPVGESPATSGDATVGETVFNTYCTACHELTSAQKVGPGLAGLFERDALPDGNPVTDANLRDWIRTGGGAMPGFALGDAELDNLLAFLHETVG